MYDDIINLKRPISSHRKMSITDRAAQFSSFQALTGYSDLINESKRLTNEKLILSEDEINILNNKLNYILQNILDKPKVKITYFVQDLKKSGGKYLDYFGYIKKIDYIKRIIVMDNLKISLDNIIDVDSEILVDRDTF